jgi:distribution and morphology protein 34
MAFNFNWSPLIGDTSRARDMLTAALNKSPKPPIIVDDIIVNELNLGSVPPELEILEIGDLAEDRFRGIFKMSYAGDAYLTLKTRVQANPLNTSLSTKPAFASPQPLAAASGLTIPIQITLSDIRLSGFVILVFSRQKGITLVFRNDPLESLKVSSTFDSIPFVRNYLQKEIEAQLRVLFMDDLPAIIHRLSLRAFVPEYRQADDDESKSSANPSERPIDPLASPPQDPSDSWADGFDPSPFSLESSSETYASFSQKNLLRLAALSESQQTLSLFTPAIRDTVFRAWASSKESQDSSAIGTPLARPNPLSRIHSSIGTPKSWSSASSDISDAPTHSSRPSLASQSTSSTVYTMGTSRSRAHASKKRKNRVVNLRKTAPDESSNDAESVTTDASEELLAPSITLTEPPQSPRRVPKAEPESPQKTPTSHVRFSASQEQSRPSSGNQTPTATPRPQRPALSAVQTQPLFKDKKKAEPADRSSSASRLRFNSEGSTGGILEQAWMMKMAAEVTRRVQEEKATGGGFWHQADEPEHPPPAYAA